MMLRPIELDAAADPRAKQADERGLDDVLAVEDVVAGLAILDDVDPAADGRQHHRSDVVDGKTDRHAPSDVIRVRNFLEKRSDGNREAIE